MRIRRLGIVVAVAYVVGCQGDDDGRDSNSTASRVVVRSEGDIDALLAQMTLEEKATLLQGIPRPAGEHAVGNVAGVPRLGIPAQRLTDGPAGVRDGQPATAFPAPVSMAASFDPALVREVATHMGHETKARGYQVLYSPMINIVRVAEAGRNFESFGEDPHLAGELAVAHIQGVQSQGVAAQVKHFAANNQEKDRKTSTSDVDERTLREIYFPAFEAAVKRGGAWSLMCAYNQLNGVFSCENASLLHDLLKVEWGFDGVVGSDYPAVHSTVASAKAGLDQEFGGTTYFSKLPDAVRSGELPQSVLDDQARRVLRMMFRTGLLSAAPAEPAAVDPKVGADLARRAAARGSVLLKNDGALLPLDAASLSRIAVIGPYAKQATTGGGGSSKVTPYADYVVSPLDGITKRAGSGVAIHYVSGANAAPVTPIPAGALEALTVEYFANPTLTGTPVAVGTDSVIAHDWGNQPPASGVPATNWSARWTGTLHAPVTGDYPLATTSDDGSRLYLDGRLVVDNWGAHGTRSVYRTVHLEAGQSYEVRVEYYQANQGSNLTVSWMLPGQLDAGIQSAVDAAKAADVAIVLVRDEAAEGRDRGTISLYGNQNALVAAVAAANPRTVVVLSSGAPVNLPWASAVPSVLENWYAGEQDGAALADVLFGDAEPAGRLPVTFPVEAADGPIRSPEQYPGVDQRYTYAEKLEVGYRWFDAHAVAPLFPFGHGLSYTSFAYSHLSVERPARDGSVRVSFDVQNTGARTGTAVPQVYVGFPARAGEPPQRLAAFRSLTLEPGATTRVTVPLDRRAFSIWDVAAKAWNVPGGFYSIRVGASSRDLRLRGGLARTTSGAPASRITTVDGQCLEALSNASPRTTSCNTLSPSQRWHMADDASLQIRGKCATVTGTAIHLADCNATDEQKWHANASGQIVHATSGLCLASNGAHVTLATCGRDTLLPANQLWNVP
ncbi:glycoside hydrolase family 3 C-terminal domain-containing protein [Pendulispora rubella]|uniref:Glycoside hydrolase family 3 C-terminal domain-containing protein n=1 Tax=Pendulispora rubella TaxID=2741070 RepID=A0ABZ2LCS4_9BACT